MLAGHGMASGDVDRIANRRPRRIFRRPSERKNPLNAQFERQVAMLESRHQEQRCIIFTVIPRDFYQKLATPLHMENGNNHLLSESTLPVDNHEPSPSPPMVLIPFNVPDESHKRCLDNPSMPPAEKSTSSNCSSNSDFLVNSFTKTSADVKHSSRRKSKKKSKGHRQHCRKPSYGSEIECIEGKNAAPAMDIVDGEDLTLSPKHVADIPFEDTSGSSSVKEVSEEAPDSENDNEYHSCVVPSVSSASCCDEMELSGTVELGEQFSSNICRYMDNTSSSIVTDSSVESCYGDSSGNCSDDTKAMVMVRNEFGCDPCHLTDIGVSSNGVGENWLGKSSDGNSLCYQNGVSCCNGMQGVQSCSDASNDSGFHLVISRKRARRKKKISLWKSFNGEQTSSVIQGNNEKYTSCSSRLMIKELCTKGCSHRPNNVGIQPRNSTKDIIHKPSNACVEAQNVAGLKDSKSGMSLNNFTGLKENHSGKSKKCPDLGEMTNICFKKVQHIDSSKLLSNIAHTRERDGCQIRCNSASEQATQKSAKENFILEASESTYYIVRDLPMETRGSQTLVPADDATDANNGLPSPGMTSSLNSFSHFEPKPQNKIENTAWSRSCSTEHDLDTHSAVSKFTKNDLEVGCGAVPASVGDHSLNDRKFHSSQRHLIEMTNTSNDAYEAQVAEGVHLVAGHPIADFEAFIYSAAPVIDHVPYIQSSNCLRDPLVGNSLSQHHISDVSLRSMWEWYEEPGCYGLEVKAHDVVSSKRSSCNGSEFCAYFVPYLSAIQLFGWSRKNTRYNFRVGEENLLEASTSAISLSSHQMLATFEQSNVCLLESSSLQDHGELLFEYFESEQPSLRPSLFEKIRELVSGVNLPDDLTLGDPEQLENVKLCDLHPSSWFSVAWYPIYRIPHGNFRAAFLTYHSLGKLVRQTCSPDMAGDCTHMVCPVVGLQSYNDKGEQWFQLISSDDDSRANGADVLEERLRILRRGASAMSRAVIPRETGESVNRHPDYEFFLSRST